MKTVLIENTWLRSAASIIETGWGNGYVVIPEGHPLHGKDYDDIDVDVHGGLTFARLVDEEFLEKVGPGTGLTKEDIGSWMVGFDTAHYNDNKDRWPKEAVQAEADRLKTNLEELSLSLIQK